MKCAEVQYSQLRNVKAYGEIDASLIMRSKGQERRGEVLSVCGS